MIENEALQDGIGDIPCGWSSAPRLMVDESQLAAARAIIRQADQREDSYGDTKCTDRAVVASSGFGWPPDRRADSEPTRCLACQELMADSDTICPSCGWTYEANVKNNEG